MSSSSEEGGNIRYFQHRNSAYFENQFIGKCEEGDLGLPRRKQVKGSGIN